MRNTCYFPVLSMSYLKSTAARPSPRGKAHPPHCKTRLPLSHVPVPRRAETPISPLSRSRSGLAREQSWPCPEAGDLAALRTAATRVDQLRRTIAKLETSLFRAAPASLSLGVPEIHRHLPGDGLA